MIKPGGIRGKGIKSAAGFVLVVLALLVLVHRVVSPILPRHSAHLSEDAVRVVVRTVHDGDTISAQFPDGERRRVRLLGVDAAEISGGTEETRFHGEMARRFAFLALFGRTVHLSWDSERTDKYGRTLAYVWTEDGTLFNELIIREGFASVLPWFPLKADIMARLREAERKARAERRGLWSGPPFPAVEPSRAGREIGRMASVSFVCRRVFRRGSVTLLESERARFQAVIPRNRLNAFKDLESLTGVRIEVVGLIEDYRGVPQIMLFSPYQIKGGRDPRYP